MNQGPTIADRPPAHVHLPINLSEGDRCEFIGFRLARTLGAAEIQELEAKGMLTPRSK